MADLLHVLRYERTAIAAGEWWRLLSGHLVHLDAGHALLNAAALGFLCLLFRREYAPRQWLAIVVGSVVAIDSGLWLLDPQVEWYAGASGVLHGIAAAGAIAHVRQRRRSGWILAAALIVKLAYEQLRGALPLTHGMPVVVDAHLYGVVGGAATALLLQLASASMARDGARGIE